MEHEPVRKGGIFLNDYTMLITCCNQEGALYSLEWSKGKFKLTQILQDNCRGIKQFGNKFICVTEFTIFILDSNFQVVLTKIADVIMDYHGVFIYENKAYIVETALNSIGIYDLSDLSRVDEIIFPPKGQDANHINDLFIMDDTMFLSMFSLEERWGEREHIGLILSYSLSNKKIKQVHYTNLSRPHSVICHNKQIFYCNSLKFEVKRGNDVIFHAPGFTRGLAIKDPFIFIGQSLYRPNKTGVCGIHVFDQAHKTKQFIRLPSAEVYDIHLLRD
jgi:hypothetical protein